MSTVPASAAVPAAPAVDPTDSGPVSGVVLTFAHGTRVEITKLGAVQDDPNHPGGGIMPADFVWRRRGRLSRRRVKRLLNRWVIAAMWLGMYEHDWRAGAQRFRAGDRTDAVEQHPGVWLRVAGRKLRVATTRREECILAREERFIAKHVTSVSTVRTNEWSVSDTDGATSF